MKFYSDVTKKLYDTQDALASAEALVLKEKVEAEEKEQKRGERAKEVEAAYKAVLEAQAKYTELKNKFIDDYGGFHMTATHKGPVWSAADINNWIDLLFNL